MPLHNRKRRGNHIYDNITINNIHIHITVDMPTIIDIIMGILVWYSISKFF